MVCFNGVNIKMYTISLYFKIKYSYLQLGNCYFVKFPGHHSMILQLGHVQKIDCSTAEELVHCPMFWNQSVAANWYLLWGAWICSLICYLWRNYPVDNKLKINKVGGTSFHVHLHVISIFIHIKTFLTISHLIQPFNAQMYKNIILI